MNPRHSILLLPSIFFCFTLSYAQNPVPDPVSFEEEQPACADSSQYRLVFIPARHPHIYSEGRIGQNETTGTSEIYWPGSFVSLCFQGDSISAVLEDEKGENYFNVLVDGEQLKVLHLEKGIHEYSLASGLSHGIHTLELHKRNDWTYGFSRFYSFSMRGSKTYAREKKKLMIEFYGNSITTGYGNEDYSGKDRPTGDYSNNYLAYGAITARNLDAEYACISHSGIGILISWHELIMSEEYDRLNPADSLSHWDFSTNNPDFVVVNLFQNDSWLIENPNHEQYIRRFGDTRPGEEAIISAYADFLGLLRKARPGAQIICLLGNMDVTKEGSPWPGYVEQAAERTGGDIEMLFLPYKNSPGHPKLEEQQAIAGSLTALIKELIEAEK